MIPVENRPMLDQAMANCKELLVLCSSLPEIDGEGREVGLCSLSVVALSHILILFFFTVLRSAEFVSKVLALSFFSIFFFFFHTFFLQGGKIKKMADAKLAKKDFKAAMLDYVYAGLHFYHAAEFKCELENNPSGARQLLRETAQLLMGKKRKTERELSFNKRKSHF